MINISYISFIITALVFVAFKLWLKKSRTKEPFSTSDSKSFNSSNMSTMLGMITDNTNITQNTQNAQLMTSVPTVSKPIVFEQRRYPGHWPEPWPGPNPPHL